MSSVEPVMIHRADELGWLARTPPGYQFRFAVDAPTEVEAREAFQRTLAHWQAIGQGEDRPVKQSSD